MVRAGRYPGLAFECGIRKNGLGKARPDYSLYGENNGSGYAVFGRLCGTLILKIDLMIICTCSDDCRLVHTLNGSYTDRRGNACPYCSLPVQVREQGLQRVQELLPECLRAHRS